MRLSSKLAAAAVAALTLVLAPAALSVVPPKGGEAVRTKYATESLLLGVTRAGKRIVAVGEYGNIVLSDDDGKTWRQAEHVPSTVTLTAVAFVDEKTGWAVGHDTLILHTTDGGENWVKQFGGGESDNALLSVYFKTPTQGFAVGAFNYTVETTDAGKTWVERKTLMPPPAEGTAKPVVDENADPTAPKSPASGGDPYAAASGDENHLNQIFAGSDSKTLFIAAEAGAVYRSADEGTTWTKILTGYPGSFWGGLTAKDGTVYVTGMRGNIWASKDKGLTFAKLDTSGADQSIASGIQLEDGSLVFVGLGGQVLYSADGAKYTLTYRPDRKGLNAVISDGDTLYVFGEAGIRPQSRTAKPEEIDVPLPAGDGE